MRAIACSKRVEARVARIPAFTLCLFTLAACQAREDVVGCVVHNGSVQYCLEQGPPLPDTARLYALDECRSVNGTLVDQCPQERRLGRCDWPAAATGAASPVGAPRRTYFYADPGGLKAFDAQSARRECRAGTWVAELPAEAPQS